MLFKIIRCTYMTLYMCICVYIYMYNIIKLCIYIILNWQSVYVKHYVLQCFAICSGIPVSLRTSLNRRFGFDSQSLAEEVSGQSHHFVAILKGVEMGIPMFNGNITG